jgi:large subunit ribosomal protein L5
MNRLQEQYEKEIAGKLAAELEVKNVSALPKLEKVIINAGLGKSIQDSSYVDTAVDVLAKISGQSPVKTLARKSISNFKVREGMVVGAKVTLRGEQMYAFIDKLVNVALPRVRDFRGLSRKSFDGQGNYSIGFKEHIVFPEISSDDVEQIVGLEVNVVTSAESNEHGMKLLEHLGFPFEKTDQKN